VNDCFALYILEDILEIIVQYQHMMFNFLVFFFMNGTIGIDTTS
jgi:hypothetical protein